MTKVLAVLTALAFLALSAEANRLVERTIADAQVVPLAIPDDEYEVKPSHPGDSSFKLRAGINGEFMGIGGGISVQTRSLASVAVPRDDYAPLTSIKASYMTQLTAQESVTKKAGVIIASAQYSTSRPTINLANFLAIQDIKCSADGMTIAFKTDASAKLALAQWNLTAQVKLAFLVNHEWKCNGEDAIAIREAQSIVQGEASGTLKITTATLKSEDVISDFDMTLEHFDAAEDAVVKSKNDVSTECFNNWNKEGQKKVSVDVNYNAATGKAVKDLTLLKITDLANLQCTNCFLHGEAAIRARVTGTSLLIKSYSLEVSTDFAANMDLTLNLFKKSKSDLVKVGLFVKPLGSVTIPGLVEFEPSLRLDAGIEYSCAEDVVATTGVGFQFPLKWSLTSNGLFDTPKLSVQGGPKVTRHPFQLSKDIEIKAYAHFIPSFVFDFKFCKADMHMALELDNEYGIEISRGKYAGCPNSLNVFMYTEHDLAFLIESKLMKKRFDLWVSGRLEIGCPVETCRKCLPGSTTSATVSATTTKATTSGTATGTATGTASGSATATATGSGSATATATGSQTGSATATATGSGSATATATFSGSATATATGSGSATATATGSGSATATATGSGSATATATPTSKVETGTTSATVSPTDSASSASQIPTSTSTSAASTSTSTSAAASTSTASGTATAPDQTKTTGTGSATATASSTATGSASSTATGSASSTGTGSATATTGTGSATATTGSGSATATTTGTGSATATTGSGSATATTTGTGSASATTTGTGSATTTGTATATTTQGSGTTVIPCPPCPGGTKTVIIVQPTATVTTTVYPCPVCPGGTKTVIIVPPTQTVTQTVTPQPTMTTVPCGQCPGGIKTVIIIPPVGTQTDVCTIVPTHTVVPCEDNKTCPNGSTTQVIVPPTTAPTSTAPVTTGPVPIMTTVPCVPCPGGIKTVIIVPPTGTQTVTVTVPVTHTTVGTETVIVVQPTPQPPAQTVTVPSVPTATQPPATVTVPSVPTATQPPQTVTVPPAQTTSTVLVPEIPASSVPTCPGAPGCPVVTSIVEIPADYGTLEVPELPTATTPVDDSYGELETPVETKTTAKPTATATTTSTTTIKASTSTSAATTTSVTMSTTAAPTATTAPGKKLDDNEPAADSFY
ncbi:hypothetical protein AMAG_08832 [Allomyces macrogynus ATCC 38327]|uniref:DUF7029 domain-containing protein n=1 Tax=Allomyces macrogynus (strain ATCC 38327) TaxID=578462 RepID=A0A0L0SN05_ALLM3|nr:hypothetical protein AMAG_08832 [Allomyces macrogynus ATCC 38327]|eukprot:KNE63749.1 hypothetical protein AMAG_08832 [Allomyces macrogynus ATCC 38327]